MNQIMDNQKKRTAVVLLGLAFVLGMGLVTEFDPIVGFAIVVALALGDIFRRVSAHE